MSILHLSLANHNHSQAQIMMKYKRFCPQSRLSLTITNLNISSCLLILISIALQHKKQWNLKWIVLRRGGDGGGGGGMCLTMENMNLKLEMEMLVKVRHHLLFKVIQTFSFDMNIDCLVLRQIFIFKTKLNTKHQTSVPAVTMRQNLKKPLHCTQSVLNIFQNRVLLNLTGAPGFGQRFQENALPASRLQPYVK